MLKITEAKPLEKWFPYEFSGDEHYLVRYVPTAQMERFSDFEMCKAVLIDWKGVLDHDGAALPCTDEARLAFMQTEAGAERFMWIMTKAAGITNFLDTERMRKNLSAPSAGGSHSQPQPANGATNANASVAA